MVTRHRCAWLPPATRAPDHLIDDLLVGAGIPCVEPPVLVVRSRTMPDASEDEVRREVRAAVERSIADDGVLAVDARDGVMLALGPTSRGQLLRVEAHVSAVLDAWAKCLDERDIELEQDELAERIIDIIVTELIAVRRVSIVPLENRPS